MKINSFYGFTFLISFALILNSCEINNTNELIDEDEEQEQEQEDQYVIPTEGLVCYYEFSGNANDLSGNGNNGIINGAILSKDRFLKSNEAYQFDGINDYIVTSNPSFLNNQSGTFIAWVKLNHLDHVTYIGSVSDNNNNYISMLRIEPKDSTVGLYCREPVLRNMISSTTQISTGKYYQLALRSNGTKWDIFINGIQDEVFSTYGSNCGRWFGDLSVVDKFEIGGLNFEGLGVYPYFDGIIDQVLLYDKALSGLEIYNIYVNTKGNYDQ